MDAELEKVVERAKTQRDDAEEEKLREYARTAMDRICLRVGETRLPAALESVCVEVTCALYNRMYHEGQTSENVDTFSLGFVDDVIKLYDSDFAAYLMQKERAGRGMAGKVVFL